MLKYFFYFMPRRRMRSAYSCDICRYMYLRCIGIRLSNYYKEKKWEEEPSVLENGKKRRDFLILFGVILENDRLV